MTAEDFLELIAEGLYKRCEHDRYVILDNPEYKPDNGHDPYLVWDCWDKERAYEIPKPKLYVV